MRKLHIDIETFSEVDLLRCGLYKYAMDKSFDILLCCYAYDDEDIHCFSLANGMELSREFISDLMDPAVRKVAHNAAFERVCLTMYLRRQGALKVDEWLDPIQWDCTMVQCARCGLPLSLAEAGSALGFDKQKMTEGKELIRLFCLPIKSESGKRLFGENARRVYPSDSPVQWNTFECYCIRDVYVERQIDKTLSWYEPSDFERELYAIDQHINDRGVLVDMTLARAAQTMDANIKARLQKEALDICGVSPTSLAALKDWLEKELGRELPGIAKAEVGDLLKADDLTDNARRVLQIRQEVGKASCAKYDKMIKVACEDERARGLTQFYGSRTGRYAGRLVQMQNLPQNHLDDESLDFARGLLREGDYASLELIYGNVPDVMSQLIRTAFIAKPGCTFAVCDFSAIEARVLAWMAGEQWVLDAFRDGKDIYCETASQMFHVNVVKNGENGHLRQRGKVAVLALGYGGGINALDRMGGARLGMTEQEEADTVKMWRAANPKIVELWRQVETAVKRCVLYRAPQKVGKFTFRMEGDCLTAELPSGRLLSYPKIEITWGNDYGFKGQTAAQKATSPDYIVKEKKSLHPEKYIADGRLRFMGVSQESNKWGWIETYGGRLVENLTQAVARDCLAVTMARVEKAGYPVVFHVHDELICEVPKPFDLTKLTKIFSLNCDWNEGLPLKGAGYTTDYYKKD